MRKVTFLLAAATGAATLFGAPDARPFGKLSDGRETHVWRLQSSDGLIMDFTDYGGRLVRAHAPGRFGNMADVTAGFNTAAEYEEYGFSMGTLVGRYANRIADGKFAFETQRYPDSPSRPDFPATVLRPGEMFRSTAEHRFGTEQ